MLQFLVMIATMVSMFGVLVHAAEHGPNHPQQGREVSPHELYQKYCASCHGRKGEGSPANTAGMIPPPRIFSNPTGLVDLTRERMIQSVREGRPGTAMPGWGRILDATQIEAVVDYVQDRLMPAEHSPAASLGRKLYAENCSVCHGDNGETAVWAQSGLTPPPRNFTTAAARKELTYDRMVFSVRYGRPETAMPPWNGRLSEAQIHAVVKYIREAIMFKDGDAMVEKSKDKDGHKDGQHGAHNHEQAMDPAAMSEPMPQGLQGNPEWGKRFYQANCAVCHGKDGDGRGPRSDFIDPKPRNFRHSASQHKYNRPHLFEAVAQGEMRTEMPAWNKVITPQEIANVSEYVFQTFIQPGHVDKLHGMEGHEAPTSTHHPEHSREHGQ
ncbi:MAG: c-type cytochrome [Magnetococcales bacterium]|nr:c-type cytochrome [Magnetococcales bacterium]HIJ83574.1 c-type cytochrome [Magnetococcales bacterium]